MTFVFQQLFQISLESGLCFNHGIEGLLHRVKSSASMLCHFNSSRAMALLRLSRTKTTPSFGNKLARRRPHSGEIGVAEPLIPKSYDWFQQANP
jgi:hypothetical protein